MRFFLFASLSVLACACGTADRSPAPANGSNVVSGDQGGTNPAPNQGGKVAVGTPRRGTPSQEDALSADERNAREEDTIDYAAVGTQASAIRYRARYVDGYPGLLEFVMSNTGSGWVEKFLLQTPRTAPTGPVPALVVFHKYGSSHADVLNTSFLAEARARGWYCIAPLGARQKNFGDLTSQINVRAALNLVASQFPIDRTRVYGVGFSMGGGAVANYAERHLDPSGIMFAAICDHTGSVGLSNTWFNEPDDNDADDNTTTWTNLEVPDVLEQLFGGTPFQRPFEYQRCSSIDLDPTTGVIDASTDMARNLDHVPTLVWVAANDPMAYLYDQTIRFHGHIQWQSAARQLQIAPGTTHQWTTLDDHAVCDWLAQYQLTIPTSGSTLADEDGVWFRFQIEQDSAGAFTPFTWAVDAATKTFTISQTANLKRLLLDPAAHNVAPHGTLTFTLSTADGTGDRIKLLNIPAAPTQVRRDNLPAAGTYDSATSTYNFTETDSAPHTWTLTFP